MIQSTGPSCLFPLISDSVQSAVTLLPPFAVYFLFFPLFSLRPLSVLTFLIWKLKTMKKKKEERRRRSNAVIVISLVTVERSSAKCSAQLARRTSRGARPSSEPGLAQTAQRPTLVVHQIFQVPQRSFQSRDCIKKKIKGKRKTALLLPPALQIDNINLYLYL